MKKSYESHVQVPSKFISSVDIIVPFHGQYDKVTNLIESIFKFTRSNYYMLYAVDDCSPNDGMLEKMSENARKRNVQNFKAMRCSSQKGFAGACQAAYERSKNPYVCFINSDCVIEDIGWLRTMGETLLDLKTQGVRMVSARTNNPVNGDPAQKGEKGTAVPDTILKPGEFLSMYCFLCHRELFPRCGGFLKNYPYGYYEDEEFAYRMNRHGYKQAVAGSSWVYHEGECTVKSLWAKSVKIKKIMTEENMTRCQDDIKALKKR
jgi:GT2 family glycosyltransferase